MVRIISQPKQAYIYSGATVTLGPIISLLIMWNKINLLEFFGDIVLFMIFAGMLAIPAYFISRKKTIEIDNENFRYFVGDELKIEFPLWKIFKIENKLRIRKYTSAFHLIIWENNKQVILNLNDWEVELEKMMEIFKILINYSTEYKFKIENKLNW